MILIHSIEWTIERGEDDAFDVIVEYAYKPGHPGQLYGPPEHCFPPEGPEIEFISVRRDKREFDLTDDEYDAIELHICENPPSRDDF